ncbi:MAG: type I-E CRISPR-associated protein Cse2/CasB [Actinomyces sp.]|uniref:type I-E CRISPR-associated protein Cse2/CasB n=1 Tax=Actinomyces sp. TaxID=29317 RepID=UPI0026DA9F46|nr:type I-E CRISPR-associated protein Cse2/CasB [Actinomyces sp.]MDO4244094.1 type I-E CRISPR-associated protein Cse2/CasB [Actinomyces sp.]
MTAPDTNDTKDETDGVSPEHRRQRRLRTAAGHTVDRRVGGRYGLQRRYLNNESRARADMAALRKAANKAPGELPEIWELTRVQVADNAGDAPTWEEIAVHASMTMYAVHQQSKTDPMFRPGVGLGRAARELVGRDEENPSARARFNALVTSATITELRHHVRSFISQLRAQGISVDHAMLADDLVDFQRPGGAKSVRLRWARQYASIPITDDTTSASSTPLAPTTSNPEI